MTESEKDLSLSFWVLQSSFTKRVFRFEHSFYEKCRKLRKENRKIMIVMLEIVATNIIARQRPERQPTATLALMPMPKAWLRYSLQSVDVAISQTSL